MTTRKGISLHYRSGNAIHARIGDDITLKEIDAIKGVQSIIYSTLMRDHVITINNLFDFDKVIAEILALNGR